MSDPTHLPVRLPQRIEQDTARPSNWPVIRRTHQQESKRRLPRTKSPKNNNFHINITTKLQYQLLPTYKQQKQTKGTTNINTQ